MNFRRYKAPLRQCEYLPDRDAAMVYAEVESLTESEYLALINKRWRRFGYWLFRPECSSCKACQPIRVPVKNFRANRIQRRIARKNQALLRLEVGMPVLDTARVDLYIAHHLERSESRGWRPVDESNAVENILNFSMSPLPVQEWAYYLRKPLQEEFENPHDATLEDLRIDEIGVEKNIGSSGETQDGFIDELVAVSYVDQLPDGFSGIYFYHSPKYRSLSLGNWICLSMIEMAKELGYDYVYFGYYVKGSISMEYKAAFAPNEVLVDGQWIPFR